MTDFGRNGKDLVWYYLIFWDFSFNFEDDKLC